MRKANDIFLLLLTLAAFSRLFFSAHAEPATIEPFPPNSGCVGVQTEIAINEPARDSVVGAGQQSRDYYVGKGVYHGVYDKTLALLPMAQALRAKIVIQLKMTERSKVLDLGCGTGRIGLEVLKSFPKAEISGVDFSSEMATVAVANGYPKERVFSGSEDGNLQKDVWATKFTNAGFDNITMNMVSYMMQPKHLDAIFGHVAQKLVTGGRFAMTILKRGSSNDAFLAALQGELNQISKLENHERLKVMEANRGLVDIAVKYTSQEIQQLGAKYGLVVVHSSEAYYGLAELLVMEKLGG